MRVTARNARLAFVLVASLISLLSINLRAQETIRPPTEPLPHEWVRSLGNQVAALVAQTALTKGQGTALSAKLSAAKSSLNEGGALPAIRHLESFKHQTRALVQGRVLTSTQGQPLIEGATAAQTRTSTLAFGARIAQPGPPQFAGCVERPPCEYTTLYVNARPVLPQGLPDGSPRSPFLNIADALGRAAADGLCGVEVRVANGHYDGDLVLSRGTRIYGASRAGVIISGSIKNYGGYELRVERVTLSGSSAPGAIVADAHCPTTTVIGVLIDRPERYGIFQRGGTLTVAATEIRRTRAQADPVFAGTGIYLTDGVQTALGPLVTIDQSGSAGLVAEGDQTRVYAVSVAVTRSEANPLVGLDQLGPAGFGAVAARHGALMLMEFCTISDNQHIGLTVDDGAQAHFRYGTVSFTREVIDDIGRRLGGVNIMARNATLELSNFTLSHGTAGLVIFDAYVTASDGAVSHNVIGVHVDTPDDDPNYDVNVALDCIDDEVIYDNDRNFDGNALPLPCGPFTDPCPDGSRCRRVLF